MTMRSRRTPTERRRAAIGQWVPLGGRAFALIVLVAFGAVTMGLFTQW
jgi:hypothetical protein